MRYSTKRLFIVLLPLVQACGNPTASEFCIDIVPGTCAPAGIDRKIVLLTLEPDSKRLVVGDTVLLTVRAWNRDGAYLNLSNRSASWTSSDVAIARVDGLGLVTAVGVGRAQITATWDSLGSTALIEVTQGVR